MSRLECFLACCFSYSVAGVIVFLYWYLIHGTQLKEVAIACGMAIALNVAVQTTVYKE